MTETNDEEMHLSFNTLDQYSQNVERLTEMYQSVQSERGISRQDAVNLEGLIPEFSRPMGGLQSFTTNITTVNYQVSLESILSKTKEAILKMFKFVRDLIVRLMNWLKGLWTALTETMRGTKQQEEATKVLETETQKLVVSLPAPVRKLSDEIIERCANEADEVFKRQLFALATPLFWGFRKREKWAMLLNETDQDYKDLLVATRNHVGGVESAVHFVYTKDGTAGKIEYLDEVNSTYRGRGTAFKAVREFVESVQGDFDDNNGSPLKLFKTWHRYLQLKTKNHGAETPKMEDVLFTEKEHIIFTPNDPGGRLMLEIERVFAAAYSELERKDDVPERLANAIRRLVHTVGEDLQAIHIYHVAIKDIAKFRAKIVNCAYNYRRRVYEALVTASYHNEAAEDMVRQHAASVRARLNKLM